ncbi:MAG: hypothetical protein COA78_32430 [Blastopirellula sp.]|nr:MAG: hypothetical protein COA78_32430 [Blastopirellula sp.]
MTKDIGRDIKCPDCFKVFLIPKPTPKREEPQRIDLNDEDPYALKEADPAAEEAIKEIGRKTIADAKHQAQVDAQRHELSQTKQNAFDELEGHAPKKARESLTPEDYDPRESLVEYPLTITSASIKQDIHFFSDSAVSLRFLFMVLGLSFTMYVFYNAVFFYNYQPPDFGTMFLSLMLSIITTLLSVLVISFIISAFLNICTSVATGTKYLEWPENSMIDRIMETVFFGIAICYGAVPAGLLGGIIHPILGLFGSFCTLFIFPVAYLSMLETGSLFNPYSPHIFGSFARLPLKWLLFYIVTSCLAAMMAVCIRVGIYLTGEEKLPYIIIPTAALIVSYTFVYALLLGKLGWECSKLDDGDSDDLEE